MAPKHGHDVVILGGGLIGCSLAFELADVFGLRPLVLERALPGAESSSAAAGILGAQIEQHQPVLDQAGRDIFSFAIASRTRHAILDARLRELVGFGSGYRRCGAMRVTTDDPNVLAEKYVWQRNFAYSPKVNGDGGEADPFAATQQVEVLSREDAMALEGELSPKITGAVRFPEEGQVDPPQLLRALQQGCVNRGVRFQTGVTATGIEQEGSQVRGVRTSDGLIGADVVVVAAGSWTSLVEGLPRSLRAVRPVRGQIVQVETRPPLFSCTVFGDRGYVVPRLDGRTLLGSTMEEVGHRKDLTVGGLHQVLSMALEIAPGLADAPVTGSWAGFRPATEGGPMIGAVPEVSGLYIAAGHHRNGILLAPETAFRLGVLVAQRGKTTNLIGAN